MVFHKGTFIPEGSAELHLLNRSFRYGDGLFETMRVFNGRLLFLSRHLKRLFRGMELLGFSFSPQEWEKQLEDSARTVIKHAKLTDQGRLRLHVFRSGPGAYTPVDDEPHFLIEGYALKYDPYRAPFPLSMAPYQDWPLTISPLSGCKTANSLPYIIAGRYAKEQGADEALMFDVKGNVAEGNSANLFWVKDKKIYTPPLETGCLDGVMRRTLIYLTQTVQLPFQEKHIKLKELLQADEVLLTNTIRGIQPVKEIAGVAFPGGKGPMGSFLQNCLLQYVEQGL